MNNLPIFASTAPRVTVTALPATANTNRDGTGTVTSIYTSADTNGTNVYDIIATNQTNNAEDVSLYYKPSGGGTWIFIGNLLIAAATYSATVASGQASAGTRASGMPVQVLNNGDQLGAAPYGANLVNIEVLTAAAG